MTVELEWVGAALCILRKRTAPFPHGGVVRLPICLPLPRQRGQAMLRLLPHDMQAMSGAGPYVQH